MTTVLLGLRSSGSYGSLQQQVQNGFLAIQTSPKENVFHWICKFAGRKKVGMLLLCVVSAAVFAWVLYVGKGEDAQERDRVPSITLNKSIPLSYSKSSPIHGEQNNNNNSFFSSIRNNVGSNESIAQPPLPSPLSPPPPPPPPPPSPLPLSHPPPPVYFTGYALPSGNPCESFTLPPPPADKKRTGPRRNMPCMLPSGARSHCLNAKCLFLFSCGQTFNIYS
ncbi:hypothetical protein CsSME_00032023 [Camellia sinensis var. sinensis]